MERGYKQMLVVRGDLNMRKGKIGAQCAHASQMALLSLMSKEVGHGLFRLSLTMKESDPMAIWLSGKFTKVCVKGDSLEHLLELKASAESRGLLTALVVDSGLTEFHGVHTPTVLAIGPATEEELKGITDHLSLL